MTSTKAARSSSSGLLSLPRSVRKNDLPVAGGSTSFVPTYGFCHGDRAAMITSSTLAESLSRRSMNY